MEINSGSPTNRLVGMGERLNDKGEKEPVGNSYPTYFNHVVRAFELFPISKFFGLTIQDAMNLPADQWNQIRKAAEAMPQNKHVDMEAELIKLVRDVIAGRGGDE